MKEKINFEQALSLLKQGKAISNSRGNVYFLTDGKVYSIPKLQCPNGQREEVRIYWDAILKDDWVEFDNK